MNELNTKLQGKAKLLPDLFPATKDFELKLKLINKHAKECSLAHFLSCKSVSKACREKRFALPKEKKIRNYPTASKQIHQDSMIFTLIPVKFFFFSKYFQSKHH
jgi:hypothetical protein